MIPWKMVSPPPDEDPSPFSFLGPPEVGMGGTSSAQEPFFTAPTSMSWKMEMLLLSVVHIE
jgi:hypothetical protein